MIQVDEKKALCNILEHRLDSGDAVIPTSLTTLPHEDNKIIVGYKNGEIALWDIEASTIVNHFKNPDNPADYITKVLAHKSSSLTFAASRDHSVQFLDSKSVILLSFLELRALGES